MDYQTIEFNLMVYFTIFPIHPVNTKGRDIEGLKREISCFKNYIETKGSEHSSPPEFLPFFALPYIKNPDVIIYLYSRQMKHSLFNSQENG